MLLCKSKAQIIMHDSGMARPGPTRVCALPSTFQALPSTFQALPSPAWQELATWFYNELDKKTNALPKLVLQC